MTLYRRLIKTTRPYVLASVSGSVIWSFTAPAYAGPLLEGTPAPGVSAPALLPVLPVSTSLPPLTGNGAMQTSTTLVPPAPTSEQLPPAPVRSAQLEPVPAQLVLPVQPAQAVQPVQLQQAQYQSNGQTYQEPRLLDRVGRVLRGPRGTAPVDPGMDYPKAPKVAAPPPAPGVNFSAIENKTLPPLTSNGATPPPLVASQPALFQPSGQLNPLSELVPPAPQGESTTSRMLTPPEPVSGKPALRNVAELRMIMESPSKTAQAVTSTPTASVQTETGLPKLDANAPMPGAAKPIAPGEPTEPQLANTGIPPAPEGARATASMPNPLIIPAPGVSEAKKPTVDPFANLFPADSKPATAETGKGNAEPAVADARMDQPYTGLKLDSEAAIVPKPLEPASVPPASLTSENSQELSGDNAGNKVQVAPREMPSEKPLVDLSLPSDLPQLKAAPPVAASLAPPPMEVPPPLTPSSAAPSDPQLAPVKTANLGNDITIKAAPAKEKPALSSEQKSKLDQIAARKGQKGLKGFCPVLLRDQRELSDSLDEFSLIYNGRPYALSSQDAMEKFLAEPLKYAPAAGCCDVIHLALTGEKLEGSLDYAVWYKGRLYLFAGVETMETFVAAPSSHASNE